MEWELVWGKIVGGTQHKGVVCEMLQRCSDYELSKNLLEDGKQFFDHWIALCFSFCPLPLLFKNKNKNKKQTTKKQQQQIRVASYYSFLSDIEFLAHLPNP